MQKTVLTPDGITNGANGASSQNGAGVMDLTLHITDPELRETLAEYVNVGQRHDFAMSALKIGSIALQQARGRIDVERVRQEGDRIIENMQSVLTLHQSSVADKINTSLALYFDPNSGQFSQRVRRLVENDGELASVIRARIDGDGSELAKTLDARVGASSPLMNMLNPKSSDGVIAKITKSTEDTLVAQRERILREFSLDNGDGALSRMVDELKKTHGKVGEDLQKSIESATGEFSLDNKDSALSRLVNRVGEAQAQISKEFSLDEEGSALARMRRDLLSEIEKQGKANAEFQQNVVGKLAEMAARKEESERSTRHGVEFEDAVFDFVRERGGRAGDVVERTGATTGLLRGRKVGDVVITLSPEHAAAGAKIVVEAKRDSSYTLDKALKELDEARRNRGAGVGLFALSAGYAAGAGIPAFGRHGDDIVIVWDAEDSASDVVFDAGLSVAKAISVQSKSGADDSDTDFTAIDKAIAEIQRETAKLNDITKSANAIDGHVTKILEHARIMRNGLNRQVSALNEQIDALR